MSEFAPCNSCEKKVLCGVYFETAADNVKTIMENEESQQRITDIRHVQAELHSRQSDEGCGYRRIEVNGILSLMQG